MEQPLAVCLCCTYGRPVLLGEAVKCFLDQDYPNKHLIISNDQEGVILKLEEDHPDITIINYPERFNSLGEKRNAMKDQMDGDYFFIWDDDDLYTPWRISKSIEVMKEIQNVDIIKVATAFMSTNNMYYKQVHNLFHSQACITKEYMSKTDYPEISVGEDMSFEKKARIHSIHTMPLLWYVYRWGMNIHHLSGVTDEKESWERSLNFEPYNELKGEVIIKPEFKMDYWGEIEKILRGTHSEIWRKKTNEKS